MSLSEYQKKRSFNKTSEPAGSARESRAGRPIFVVQLHHASHRHYDFRLQVGNVLRSWAVPKGPSFNPAVKRLAAQVEDHPLGYASFEGEIPEGQYGAGHVAVFDTGIWSTAEDPVKQLAKGHLRFELFGRKLKGGWHLIRTRGDVKKPQWLLVKNQDRYASEIEADDLVDDLPPPTAGASVKRAAKKKSTKPAVVELAKSSTLAEKKTARAKTPRSRIDWGKRAAKLPGARIARMPKALPAPQLATLVSTPSTGQPWIHEIKWDGYRITTMISGGRVTLWSRNGLEWTARLPDIVAVLETWRLTDGIFDGELIARRGSQADFPALQATLAGEQAASLTYVLFDALHLNGVSLTRCALRDRKTLLSQMLDAPIAHLAFSSHIEGDGARAFALATDQGFEGIISKRGDRPHVSGRGGDWTKCKQLDSEEFAVVGVTTPKGNRTGLGALLLARHDAKRGWVYAGKVGSGLSDSQLSELAAKTGGAGGKSPTVMVPANDTDLRSARWFEPMFVVEVYSRGRGSNGLLRQPSLKTLRLDKSVADLVGAPVSSASSKSGARQAKRGKPTTNEAGMILTHPERVVFPDDGYTKQQVADYYAAVMDHLLPGIVDRPLSLIRCPAGIGGQCFFQKHEISGVEGVDRVRLKEGSGIDADYLVVRDAAAVMELVQFNALEFHPWGAKADAPDAADLLVFDLDPGSNVTWTAVRAGARRIRDLLATLKLQSFVRTSGGKGLHVVVPLNPSVDWEMARPFAESFAKTMARMEPEKFIATSSKARRDGRIFIDYLRNGRGATSVASYSLRARSGAPVAMPLTWDELAKVKSASAFTIENVPKRLARLGSDPWAGFSRIRQGLDHFGGSIAGQADRMAAKPTPKRRKS